MLNYGQNINYTTNEKRTSSLFYGGDIKQLSPSLYLLFLIPHCTNYVVLPQPVEKIPPPIVPVLDIGLFLWCSSSSTSNVRMTAIPVIDFCWWCDCTGVDFSAVDVLFLNGSLHSAVCLPRPLPGLIWYIFPTICGTLPSFPVFPNIVLFPEPASSRNSFKALY